MKLLLTGAPGWLAEGFLHSLANDPGSLSGLSCLVHPAAGDPRMPDFPAHIAVRTVRGDLADPSALAAAAEGCDAVLHAAGLLHVRRTRDWYDVNTEGTRRLLEAACLAGARRFVFISSNAAGGRAPGQRILMTEDMPARPLSHYGRSKLLAEEAVLASGMDATVLRPCMFYGPPVPARHVDIYRRLLTGRMPLAGRGDHARSVTHVDNLVHACRLALFGLARKGVFYIADEEVYTTRRIVEAMADALGVAPRFVSFPPLLSQVAHRADLMLAATGLYWRTLHLVGESDWHVGVSIAKARAELGYAPTGTLRDGMRAAVTWCRQASLLPPSL